MKSNVFNTNTLVPISLIGVVFVGAFWLAGLSKDIQAMNIEINKVRYDRESLEVEIISQLRSQALNMQEFQVQAARNETKIGLIMEFLERRVGALEQQKK